MNRIISVLEGSENWTGMVTGYPIVESLMEGMLMVGAVTKLELEAFDELTVIVTGKMFLKKVWFDDSDLLK